jgi:hypothetical protein
LAMPPSDGITTRFGMCPSTRGLLRARMDWLSDGC